MSTDGTRDHLPAQPGNADSDPSSELEAERIGPANSPAAGGRNHRAVLNWVGAGLIVVWVIWFGICLTQKPLPRAVPKQQTYDRHRITNILLEPMIGLDFHANYEAARAWFAGRNPYGPIAGPAGAQYEYPPLTIAAFIWANLIPPGHEIIWTAPNGQRTVFAPSEPAILAWIAVIIALIAYASRLTARNRAALGLERPPFVFVFGVVMFSYPVLFEIERANCNVLPLLGIAVLAIALTWRNRPLGDLIGGLAVAFAIGIKPYAVVLLPGLLTLRRFRAAAFALGWLLIQAAIFAPEIRAWLAIALHRNTTAYLVFEDWSHSVVGDWQLIWNTLGLPAVGKLPAQMTFGSVLVVVSAIVGFKVYRRPAPGIAWPYLLWLTAVGTMLIPVAYDYNLIFLPFALLGAWSARDSWRVQWCVGLVLLWCQPFYFGVTGLPLLAFKAITILLSGVLIMRRLDPAPAVSLLPWTKGRPFAQPAAGEAVTGGLHA